MLAGSLCDYKIEGRTQCTIACHSNFCANSKMWQFSFAVVLAIIYCSVQVDSTPLGPLRETRGAKIPCHHPFSLVQAYAFLFEHCCVFSPWSQWAEWTTSDASCTSGTRLFRKRTRQLVQVLAPHPQTCNGLPLVEEPDDCKS